MSSGDLFELKKTRRIFTVSEITQGIKGILEDAFGEIWVEGEVSNISRIPTGTVFFNLKDDASIIKCVMFHSYAASVKFDIKDGLHIILLGRVSVYEKDGRYQLYARQIEPKGMGSLQLALEQLKQKLEKEGLFAPSHKKAMPYLPSRIGIVTSLSGAAIKDILKVLNVRFKDVHIIIDPVRVQGEGAKDEIAQAIKDINRFNLELPAQEKIEVMIVGRGGGSIEDLWAFNEEIVARAIYESSIPVISAVGHERDWTIADLVADVRAATPSVAAEMVIPKKEDLRQKLEGLIERLGRICAELIAALGDNLGNALDRLMLNIEHILELNTSYFSAAQKKLALLNPLALFPRYRDRITDLTRRIISRMNHILELKRADSTKATQRLSSLDPLNILSRGFSVTLNLADGKVIKDIGFLNVGDIIKTRLSQGEIISKITEVRENART